MAEKKEAWRMIWGYDGKYEISNRGRVRNTNTGRVLQQHVDEFGYHLVKLVGLDRSLKNHRVHRLVALNFVPLRSFDFDQVNHIDGNKWNNDWDNLEWCNNSLNQLHRYRVLKANALYGTRNPASKLSEQQISEIKAKYQTGEYNQMALAKEYNITQSAVSQIVTNKIRKYE